MTVSSCKRFCLDLLIKFPIVAALSAAISVGLSLYITMLTLSCESMFYLVCGKTDTAGIVIDLGSARGESLSFELLFIAGPPLAGYAFSLTGRWLRLSRRLLVLGSMLAALITWNVAVASFFSLQWLSWNECITGAMVVVGTALGAFVESLLHKIAQRGNTELLIHGLMPIALLFATLLWMLFSLICPDASDCQLPVQTKAMSTLSICLLALMLASGSMAHMTASDSLKRIVISTIFAVVPFGTLLAIGAIGDLFYPYYASACLLLMVGIVGLACLSTLIGYKLRCLLPTPPLPRQSIS